MSTTLQRTRATGLVSMDQWQIMREQASMLVKSGFLPRTIDTPEKAVAVILKGQEIGIPAMHALSNIVVISGKPTCNAELLLALIYRDHGDQALVFEESTPEHCTISYARRGWTERRRHSFTLAEAKQAELTTGSNAHSWRKYPAQMLRARCISAVARMAFADSIGGMYTPEELDGPVEVNPETGEITTVESTAREIPAESSAPSIGSLPSVASQVTTASPTGELEAAWKEYRHLAPQAGYGTTDDQKAHIQEAYPGRKPKELTLAEVQALIADLAHILDLPAGSGDDPDPLF